MINRPCLPAIRLLVLVLALAGALPDDASATLRKCGPSEGAQAPAADTPLQVVDGVFIRVKVEKPLLMVDGVVIGDMPDDPGGDVDFSYTSRSGVVRLTKNEIRSISVICLEQEVDGRLVSRDAISIVTRAGEEGMLRSYLADLVELQEVYRRSHDGYAANLDDLGFRRGRLPLPIELIVSEGGWSVSARLGSSSCRVAVGSPDPPGSSGRDAARRAQRGEAEAPHAVTPPVECVRAAERGTV